MTKEEVLKTMEKDLRFSGSMYIAFGVFLLLPCILMLLVMIDTLIETTGGDILGLLKLQAFFLIFTAPGILLLRMGMLRRKGKNNKIYAAYAENPGAITWVYERFTNMNGRDLFYVILCDDSGKSHEIQSTMSEYRILYESVKAHCPNAVYGYKDEWRPMFKKDPKNFKVNVMQSK